MKMLAKCRSLLLVVLMLVFLVPSMGLAQETHTYTIDADMLPSSDELLEGYFQKQMMGGISLFSISYGEAVLNEREIQIYRLLKTAITEIAAKGGSATVSIPDSIFDDLVLTSSGYQQEFADAVNAQLIFNALTYDCPYEMYWVSKQTGMQLSYSLSGTDADHLYIQNMKATIAVSSDYAAANSTNDAPIVTSDVSRVTAAAEEILRVVEAHQGEDDLTKLESYKKYICDAVAYNTAAAESSNFGSDEPWQLIYVFDQDASTKVVCEGYSKAFQRLWELSSFNGECESRIMTGVMAGGTGAGPHMWNVVTLNGANYLVDVTNSDADTIGQDGKLFMTNTTVSGDANGYVISAGGESITFTYDAATKAMYSAAERTLHAHDYTVQKAEAKYLASAATCTSKATYYLSCSCGEKGTATFEYGNTADHNFNVPQHDENQHWNKCATCDATDKKIDHIYPEKSDECACGYQREHVHVTTAQTGTAATCTTPGVKDHYVCYCGKKFLNQTDTQPTADADLALDALNHLYTNNIYVKNGDGHSLQCERCEETDTLIVAHTGGTATCTAQAECAACNTPYGELASHSYGETKLYDANGHWTKCKNCDATTASEAHTYDANDDKCESCDYKKKHVHDPKLVPGTAATCTTEGKLDTYTCYCNKIFLDKECTKEVTDAEQLVINVLGHKYEQKQYVPVDNGHSKKCDVCGVVDAEVLAHTGGTATCTAKAVCADCGASYGDLAEHSFTVAQKDEKDHWNKCADCDATDTKVAHDFIEKKNNATYHWSKCSGCDAITGRAKHTFEENDDHCTGCKFIRNHTHVPVLEKGKAATCTEDGVKDSYTCYCSKIFLDEACISEVTNANRLVIKALGHDYAKNVWVENGAGHSKQCDRCQAIDTVISDHTGGTATCTAKAVCADCGASYGDLAEHSFTVAQKDEKDHWNKCANCDATDTKVAHTFTVKKNNDTHHWTQCSGCDATTTQIAHTYAVNSDKCECGYEKDHIHAPVLKAGKAATCTETGVKDSYTCYCNKTFLDKECTMEVTNAEQLVIDALGHKYEQKQYVPVDNGHSKKCDVCGVVDAEVLAHTGGTATCTTQAKCEACGESYGELAKHSFTVPEYDSKDHWNKCANCNATDTKAPHAFVADSDKCTGCKFIRNHTHAPKQVAGTAADCTTAGTKAHYSCFCGEKFLDAGATQKVTDAELVIEVLGHDYTNEVYVVSGTGHSKQCDRCQAIDTVVEAHAGGTATCTVKAVCQKCGASYGELAKHNFTVSKYDDKQHWLKCDVCDAIDVKTGHVYGGDLKCDGCDYTLPADHVHTGTLVKEVPATCDQAGTKAYYVCACGVRFLDAACKNEVKSDADLVIAKIAEHSYTLMQNDTVQHWKQCVTCNATTQKQAHLFVNDLICDICGYAKGAPLVPPTYQIIEGANQTVDVGAAAGFKSNAAFDKFVKVQVDGADVAKENYTAQEGSTMVTLKPSYIAILKVGTHTLTIVSEDGFAATTFQVKEEVVEEDEPVDLPQTGDPSQLMLWMLMLVASAAALVMMKKRRA